MKLEIDRPPSSFHGMVGRSGLMIDLFRQISIVAKKEVKVLIQGERGTGKELVAKAIKNISARKNKTYKVVNCGGLTKDLMATELWGHEKGAFTGAVTKKVGLVTACHGGILFLDEIGDLGLEAQAMLLRFLQESEVRPVGGLEDIHVDVRIMAATNKDLEKEMSLGRFREDLFDRLSEITLYIPPLREREDDLELLSSYFIQKYNNLHQMKVKGISAKAMESIYQYYWPGNVRELEKSINRAVIFSNGQGVIRVGDLGCDQTMPIPSRKRRSKANSLESYFDEIYGDKISPKEKEIIRMVWDKGVIKNSDLKKIFKISDEMIRRYLNHLCSLKILEKKRRTNKSYYVLKMPVQF